MYGFIKRSKAIIAVLLVTVMLCGAGLDSLAQAANIDALEEGNTTNAAVMNLLEQEYGAEQAPVIYDTLRKLGLVNGQGELTSLPILLNGQAYSLDELKQLLNDPVTDLAQIAEVDGQPISLESLKQMMDIENRIAELQQFQDTSGVQITEEHLDSLESLIDQAGAEGLEFTSATDATYDEEAEALIERAAPLQLGSISNGDDSYEDAVHATVSNIELKISASHPKAHQGNTNPILSLSANGSLYVTFQLNRAVNREVSFAYELIGGSQGGLVEFEEVPDDTVYYPGQVVRDKVQINKLTAMSEGPLNNYLTETTAGVVVFQPNQTTVTLEIMERELVEYVNYSMYNFAATVATTNVTLDSLKTLWTNFARGDYLHFYNFKNLDAIKFAANVRLDLYDNDRWLESNFNGKARIQNRYYYPYVHSYEGGAYLAFTSYRQLSAIPVRNPYGVDGYRTTPHLFKYARDFAKSDEPAIVEVQAKPGTYSTGQIIPMIAEFNRPMVSALQYNQNISQMNESYSDQFSTSSVLQLANGGLALPEMMGDAAQSARYMAWYNSREAYDRENEEYYNIVKINYASLSSRLGFSAVVPKGATPDDLKVVGAHSMIDGFAYDKPYSDQLVSAAELQANTLSDITWNEGFSNNPTITIVPARADAFATLTTDKSEYHVGETITFTIELDPANGANDWVINGVISPEDLKTRLRLSIGDREEGLVDLDWKRGVDGLPLEPAVLEGKLVVTQSTLDLVKGSNQVDGALRAKIYYNQARNFEDIDENFIMLQSHIAPFTIQNVKYIYPEDLQLVYPTSWPSGQENFVSLVDAVSTQLGFTYPPDATYTTPDQFEWTSSDERIATIQPDGTILPKQAGTVTFTLVAVNNGALVPATSIETVPIEISPDGAAAIVIPSFANQIKVHQHQDATVLWSTNVMDKYKEQSAQGQTPKRADFKVELYAGNWTSQDLQGKIPVQVWEAPATAELTNATSFVIPGQYLGDLSALSVPSYTLRVSTLHPDPTQQGKELSAMAYIVVLSPAAIVTLDKSMGQFITDEQSQVPLHWTLDNFDPLNKGEFEFQVTKNGQVLPESVITFDAVSGLFNKSGVTEQGGSYTLNIDPVVGNGRSRDVYAITLKAKNSLDASWSYDSLYLQVYKSGAFSIQVDGQDQSSFTMSNIPTIQAMTSEQILALKRQINLAHLLAMNNGSFVDLGAITDQFAWNSTNPEVAGIYYRSGLDYDDISTFAVKSYQPKQQFTLGGLADGSTTITATHANTGMQSQLNLEVQTLKDKLYLFQFYPKALSELEYTDGQGREKRVTTNADGELALYDEKGIHSDVYVTSSFNGTTYTGVISKDSLKSQEGSTRTMDLYPVNLLQLRQLAQVEVFFKQPDGQPYTGEITYYGGVYKNGYFAEKTAIDGDGTTVTLGADGRLEIIYDTTDFYSAAAGETNAAGLSAKDTLEFLVEVHFAQDRYYPQLYSLNGDTSPVDMVAIGSKLSQLIENPDAGGAQSLFMVNQYVEKGERNRSYITSYKGRFGPGNANPAIKVITEFMWWGQDVDDAASAVLLNDKGIQPQGQSYQTFKYPFSKWYTTRHVQVLNKDTIWLDKGKAGSLNYKLYEQPERFVQSMTAPATLINMIGVYEATPAELRAKLKGIKEELTGANGRFKAPSNNDRVTLETLGLLSGLKMSVGPLSMTVIPTEDPATFRTFVSVKQGDLTSVGEPGLDINYLKNGSDNSFTPGLGDVLDFMKPSYTDRKKAEAQKNKSGQSGFGKDFSFGGYYLGEIKYNSSTGKWENVLLAGGFSAGGEFSYSQVWNMNIGPVPVTFSLTIGGGGEVSFAANALFDEVDGQAWSNPELTSVNDYMTMLRIYAYVEAFGGIGFDYSIIAAKIGVFGKLTVENTSVWLNRDYLANGNNRVLYGNQLAIEGVVGVRVVLKFLFISFSHDFASLRYSHSWMFNHWEHIQKYWKENSSLPLTAANLELATFAYMKSIGEEPMQVIHSQTLENRDYLQQYERVWNVSGQSADRLRRSTLIQGQGATANRTPDVLQSNAYPYSNPEAAADGSLAVYLSDGGSTRVEDTVASWMARSGNGYVDQGPIAADLPRGYGDTNLHVAGEGSLVAAAWVRQNQTLGKQSGDDLTNEEIMLMNNSAEIVVSIYDGQRWNSHMITNNQTPDIAPAVAVGNGKVMVSYRSVLAGNVDNPLDFTQSDQIMYTVYDVASGEWSEAEVLYNGTQGTVTGLSSEMLSDGRAAVVYTVKQMNGNQIIYSVVDSNRVSATGNGWRTVGVIKNLQVTEGQTENENPKLTSARFASGEEKFIIGWYSESSQVSGLSDSNIRLLAFDREGEIATDFVDSLSEVKGANEVSINPNFTFTRNTQANRTLDKLSILWKASELEVSDTTVTTRDTIQAVKFGEGASGLYLSGVLTLGTLPDYTEVDSISAYFTPSGSGYAVQAMILGTTYTTDTDKVGTIQPAAPSDTGDSVPVQISRTVSAMYMLNAEYENSFDAEQIVYNPEEIVPGFDLPIQFNLINQGMTSIEEVIVELDGQSNNYVQLDHAPNQNKAYMAEYPVPVLIQDIPYTVQVRFADGTVGSSSGMIKLDIPDVGISPLRMLKEENGERGLSIPIYNQSKSSLAGKGWKVQLGLYKDGLFDKDHQVGSLHEITDDAALRLMDEGGYVFNYSFDVKAYLNSMQLDEIPDSGLQLFAHVSVVDTQGEEIREYNTVNNQAKLAIEQLAVKYGRTPVLLTSSLSSTQTDSTASIAIQNMYMNPIHFGNVLVHLLDAEGNNVESRYLANDEASLISLNAEEIKRVKLHFSQKGESIQAVFFQEDPKNLNAQLSLLEVEGASLKFDPLTTSYTVESEDLRETQLSAVANHRNAVISLLDAQGKELARGTGNVSYRAELDSAPDGVLHQYQLKITPVSSSAKPVTYQLDLTNKKSGRPELALQAKGNKQSGGTYFGTVEIGLSAYSVEGFELSQAMFKVNDDAWQTQAYDGSAEASLATLSEDGVYKVAAKVLLDSGQSYDLTPVVLEIGPEDIPTPVNPNPNPSPNPSPTPEGGGNGGESPIEPKPEGELPSSPETDEESGEAQPVTGNIFNDKLVDLEATLERWSKSRDQYTPSRYADIEGHWGQSTINTWMRLGVISGYPDQSFKPNQAITRAEFAALLSKMLVFLEGNEASVEFQDISGHWSASAIADLAKHGIVKGYVTGEFKPDQTITREEILVILMRLVYSEQLPQQRTMEFRDESEVGQYAQEAVAAAIRAGIVNGYDGKLQPKSKATRAEISVMLMNLAKLDRRLAKMIEPDETERVLED